MSRRICEGGERFVIVGAGGWLGSAALELLSESLGPAFEERVVAIGSSERLLQLRGGRTAPQLAIENLASLPERPTVVLHMAFLTKDRASTMARDEYVAANRRISSIVQQSLDPIGARAIFLPSSGAAYSVDDTAASEATRLYGQLKLDDEASFGGWAARRGGRAVIARVFNLSGPYINKLQSYALASFILDALNARPIQIRADRPVFRSYVAIRELMSVVLGLLLDDADSQIISFDTAGDRAYEMAEIASVVRVALGQPQLPVCRPTLGDESADVYVGDAALYSTLRRRLGVESVDFPTQVQETAAYLRQVIANEPEQP